MANHYVHVGSITNAMRGKRLLEAAGMRTFLQKSANPPAGDGCGYSLLVTDSVDRAVGILQKNGVKVRRVSDGL